MEIRRFKIGDELATLKVFFSAIHGIASRDYSPTQIKAWAPADLDLGLWESQMRCIRPFIVEVNGEIIAYADLQPNGYIDQFFVSSDYSRQGIGSLLMKTIHEEAELLDVDELTSYVSKTAESFFIFHGFQVIERRFPVRRGVTLENALMRKNLKI